MLDHHSSSFLVQVSSAGVSATDRMGIMGFDKRGIAPPDPTTDVGKFRLLSGDSEWEPYNPDQPGYGLYQLWTDDEITALIDVAGSISRAIAMAYAQIGAAWASTGATIKTDDLSYSVKDSVGNWLTLAAYWNKIADDEDSRSADDIFDLVTVRGDSEWRKPEAAPWPWGGPPGSFRW